MTYNHICQSCLPAWTKDNLSPELSSPTRMSMDKAMVQIVLHEALGGLTGSKVRAIANRRNGLLDELTLFKCRTCKSSK
jgi:hypothetical protein